MYRYGFPVVCRSLSRRGSWPAAGIVYPDKPSCIPEGNQCMADFDLAIIGGGINGTGIARDAAGRGLRVLLVEQHDLASGTSSASTKLIHGGLRYLEHGTFRLVREALAERDVLLRMAPHLIQPMRFVLPVDPDLRSPWLLRLGLFIYDHLGGRTLLPRSGPVDLTSDAAGVPLKPAYRKAFEYSDCWVDDARLVVLNAVDAAERGATIRTRTACIGAERDEIWRLTLERRAGREVVTARILVNAAGPWIGHVAEKVLRVPLAQPARLVKGSHIVVPRLFDHDRAYLLQQPDRRVVFALPFERDFTMVGTTDADFTADPATVAVSPEEIAYLCGAANAYFAKELRPDAVCWAFAGVRALHDDGSRKPENTTRDYVLALDEPDGRAPLLTVYGGKITTYRRLAETALQRLAPYVPQASPWTAGSPLPGGEFAVDGVAAQIAAARRSWPFLGDRQATRLVRAYGTRLARVLGNVGSADALGPWFGDLSGAELRYLAQHEWAVTAEDVLWRRSKLGLHLTPPEREAVAQFMRTAAPQD